MVIKNNNISIVVFIYILSLMSLLLIQSPMANAQSFQMADKKVEDSVLAEDWAKVADLLDSVNTQTPSPVLRLIKGHACLALNRNNESLCLFLSTSSENDLKEWERWTDDFSNRNPKKVITYYFKGDALARLEKWDDALRTLSRSLELQTNHVLTLNARGTIYCAIHKWNEALMDLTKASILNPLIADVHASVGAMWIQKRDGAIGALRSFDYAIRLSPDFALAHNGKGCAKYALARWEEANEEIGKAGRHFNCQTAFLQIISHNLTVLTLEIKRSKFPFFSKYDFLNWTQLRKSLHDRKHVLHKYFAGTELPEEINEAIISKFNEILEVPNLYDGSKDRINIYRTEEKAALNELMSLIDETEKSRKIGFQNLNEPEKGKIRKLNRLILECLFPEEILQIAMNQIDSPGFSLERGIGFVQSWSFKNQLPTQTLIGKTFDMQYTYRPLAVGLSKIPVVGVIGDLWNRHLDNQININTEILGSRGIYSPSGGVDLDMRKAHVDKGNWTVGTWFGLAYHVEPPQASSFDN